MTVLICIQMYEVRNDIRMDGCVTCTYFMGSNEISINGFALHKILIRRLNWAIQLSISIYFKVRHNTIIMNKIIEWGGKGRELYSRGTNDR